MTTDKNPRVKIWSLTIRAAHWILAVSIGIAWITHHGPPWLHDAMGYVALALVCLRVFSGMLGPRRNRFTKFLAGPRATLSYARMLLMGREPRFLGHNPLGGWMILALLAFTAGTGISGWLSTTVTFWGVQWVANLHSTLADLLLVLIVIHVAGVVFTSFRQSENLVSAMVHGWKPKTTRRHPESPVDS